MEAHGGAESLRPVSRSTPNEPLLGVQGPVVLETTRLGAFRASAVAGVLLAVVNSAAIALLVPREDVGLKLRAMHYWVDAAQHLVFALAIGAVVGSCQHAIAPYLPREARGSARRTGKVMLELLAVGVGVFALLALTLPQDFVEFARRAATRNVPPYFGLGMVGVCASGVALILVALTRWWRPALGATAVFIATLLFSVNHLVLDSDYPGVHFAIASTGVLLVIAGLAPWVIFECWVRPSQVAISGLIALSLPALVIPPTRTLLVEQLKNDGSVVAMWLARARGYLRHRGETEVTVQAERRDWFLARRTEGTPPSPMPLLPDDPIIVLLTLDAVRADLIAQPKYLRKLPALRHLKEQGVYFSEARAPSSRTAATLSSIFSGLYFSQQHWSSASKPSALVPKEDKTPRFPQLLQQAGVYTVTAPASRFLVNDYGVVRGFDEQLRPTSGIGQKEFVDGARLSERLIDVLKEHESGHLFLYAHYLDARYPYAAGGPEPPGPDRYISAVSYVDRQVGRVLETLQRLGLWNRAVVIVASSYGESLGGHGATVGGRTLYEEQLHVPLVIRVPRVRPREVGQMVSLVDVGPTLLDMVGLETPAHFMGQSLTPYLRGGVPRLTRPIVAEVPVSKALYFEDGYKLIVDDRRQTAELYHLKTDPDERVNIIDEPSAKGRKRLEQLRQFFRTHTQDRLEH